MITYTAKLGQEPWLEHAEAFSAMLDDVLCCCWREGASAPVNPQEILVENAAGDPVTLSVREDRLSDGSTVFTLVLS